MWLRWEWLYFILATYGLLAEISIYQRLWSLCIQFSVASPRARSVADLRLLSLRLFLHLEYFTSWPLLSYIYNVPSTVIGQNIADWIRKNLQKCFEKISYLIFDIRIQYQWFHDKWFKLFPHTTMLLKRRNHLWFVYIF